jgi:lactate dehydrogenase-like 2-hydroxyacid dehydrogenase
VKFDRLVVLDSVIFYPEHRERLDALADIVVEYNTCTDVDQVSERCRGADGIISCWVDIPHRIIDENPQLKAVAFWTHDYEHRIDAEYARTRGIFVPAIPDYGTDSVAELVFMGLLRLHDGVGGPDDGTRSDGGIAEELLAVVSDDVRKFSRNVKDAVSGRWVHEYVKTGQLKIDSPDGIPGETLKGITLGVLGSGLLTPRLVEVFGRGLRMNVVHSLADAPHTLDASFRPVDDLIRDSQVLVYDSAHVSQDVLAKIAGAKALSTIDIDGLKVNRKPLHRQRLGILGLGRIGSRVAQIAVDGFGMDVVYFSRTRKPDLEQALGLTFVDLDELLTTVDNLSIHLPHHGAEGYLTPAMIDKLPAGTAVVNCSVGSVIADENLLLDRCEAGELRAFLDVYRTLPPKERLRAANGHIVGTYRLGWRTKATVGLKTHKLLTKLECAPALGG